MCFSVLLCIIQLPVKDSVEIKLLYLLAFLFPPDAVRKVFIQLAQSSFAGLPNLVKTAKVATFLEFDIQIVIVSTLALKIEFASTFAVFRLTQILFSRQRSKP